MNKLRSFPHSGVGQIFHILSRSITTITLVSVFTFASFVFIKGAQPIGPIGNNKQSLPSTGSTATLPQMNYWQYMANRLAASQKTPAVCQQTRLIYLAIALPLYPALYTYVALYPKSSIARHVQPSPLIPKRITWLQVPATWWKLVKAISMLAFTQSQWNYTPAIGQRVGIDQRCILPFDMSRSTK